MAVGRSRHPVGRGYFGEIPEVLWLILVNAWERGVSVSSDLARACSTEVALAASLGWITTITADGKGYSRIWHITEQGLTALHGHEETQLTAKDAPPH